MSYEYENAKILLWSSQFDIIKIGSVLTAAYDCIWVTMETTNLDHTPGHSATSGWY